MNDSSKIDPVISVSSISKILYLFSKKDQWVLLMFIGMMLLSGGLETVGVGLIFPLISIILDTSIIHSNEWLKIIYTLLDFKSEQTFLIVFTLSFLLIFIIKNAFRLLLFYIQQSFLTNKCIDLQNKLFRAYVYTPYVFHLSNNMATLSRNKNEFSTVFQKFLFPLMSVCTEVVVILSVGCFLLFQEPWVALSAVFGIGGVYVLINYSLKSTLLRLGKELTFSIEANLKAFFQAIGGIKDVQALKREEAFIKPHAFHTVRLHRIFLQQALFQQFPTLLIEVIFMSGVLGYILIELVLQGLSFTTIIPTISLFALATHRLFMSVTKILMNVNRMQFGAEGLNIVYNEIKKLNSIVDYQLDSNEKIEKSVLQEKIELKKINYHYPDQEKRVLSDLSMTIYNGQAIGLVGPSGAGKTTIVDIILGLLTPLSGEVLKDDQNIQECMTSWRKNIGYIPQFVYICDETVRQNIAFGIAEDQIDDKAIYRALKVAQLLKVIEDLPEGLETILGERGVRLSGGQRQRIGIARALYHDPKVLILDEATSALDGITEKYISESIRTLKGEKTLIIIAHRLTTVQHCDCLYFIQNGRVIDSGSYQELITKNQTFQRMAGHHVNQQ